MAVNDIYSVVTRATLHAQLIVNTFFYRETNESIGNPAAILATRFNADVITFLKPQQSNELVYADVVVQKIWPLPPLAAVIDPTVAGAGTLLNNSLPTSVAVVITKRTIFAGRKYRGRNYFAGVGTSHELDSSVSAAGLAGWATVEPQLVMNLTNGFWIWEPVIWHRATKTADKITSATTRTVLRNQRRRQVGKGA